MHSKEKFVSQRYIRNRTLLSFVVFFLFLAGCVLAWKWIHKQPLVGGTQAPFRTVLNANEMIFASLYSSPNLTKSFPSDQAVKKVRVNGSYGLGNDFDTASWRLKLVKTPGDTLIISLADIKKLPKTSVVFDFKCIEGWSQVTHWSGVKFSDFAAAYGLNDQSNLKYTSLVTPDGQYYVGIDHASMMHPQTILCYEMNDAPLPLNQGAPLRLIIPVKYGVKHLKRIGTISFSNQRPRDYWYERGYDYYCGL